LRLAHGDYVFLIDSDLEEDPELLSTFWYEMNNDKEAEVIYGIQIKRKGGWFERLSGQLYYAFFSALTRNAYAPNTLTARLMKRDYLTGLEKFQERESDLWGLFLLNGFRQKGILVRKASKGSTTYTFRRKLEIVFSTITTLTQKPLLLIGIAGIVMLLFSILFGSYILAKYAITGTIENVSLILFAIWFNASLIIAALGVISAYISKMYLEIKARPLTTIKHVYKN
jgi:putative glycosyltransferase